MTVSASMQQFVADLRACESRIERSILQFQYQLGIAVVKQTQLNIRRTFGKGQQMPDYPARQAITERVYGRSARRSGRGGGLHGSVMLEYEGRSVSVSVGGPGVPYAAAHEQGATITPRTAKYLTIPYNPPFAGTRAREHDLKFARGVIVNGEPIGAALLLRGAHVGRDGSVFESQVAFVLRKKVTIPPRPYFEPAVLAVTRGPEMRQRMMTLLGRDAFGVTVE